MNSPQTCNGCSPTATDARPRATHATRHPTGVPGRATGVPGKCNACWSGEVDARTAAFVELPCPAGRVRGRERRATDSPHLGTSMFCASCRGNFPDGQMISAPSGGKAAGTLADPAAKTAQSVCRLGTVAARRIGVPSWARGAKARGSAMAKRILSSRGVHLHRRFAMTRPPHPHGAERRCGGGPGSQQYVTAGALALALLPTLWPGDAAAHTCDAPFTTDLVTASGIDVGEVKVCNDAEFLTVTYDTTCPWCVLRTNLHVASDLAGFPKIRLLGTPNSSLRLYRGCRLRGSRCPSTFPWTRSATGLPGDASPSPPAPWSNAKARRHPPALPARRQVCGVGRGHPVPPAAPRDVLHLRGAGSSFAHLVRLRQ